MKSALIALALASSAMCITLETHKHGMERKHNLELNIERVKTYRPAVYRKMRDTTAKGFEEANPMFPSRHFHYNKDGSLNLDNAQWNQPKKAVDAPKHKMHKKDDSSCSDSHDDHKKKVVAEKKVVIGAQA